MVISAGVVNANAAGFDDGHRFGADIKLTETLGLSSVEQMALTNALATYGPAVKTAMQSFQAARVQLRTDLNAASPVGSQLAAMIQRLLAQRHNLKRRVLNLQCAKRSTVTCSLETTPGRAFCSVPEQVGSKDRPSPLRICHASEARVRTE